MKTVCPFTGQSCLKDKLYHITEIQGGKSKSVDLCIDCIQDYVNEDSTSISNQPIGMEPIDGPIYDNPILEEISPIMDVPPLTETFPKIPFKGIVGEFVNFILNSGNPSLPETPIEPMKLPVCPSCGITILYIQEHGKVGCPGCYSFFGTQLIPLLARLHNAVKHVGKVPKKWKESQEKNDQKEIFKTQIESLEEKLRLAISEERYEDAAIIQNEIDKLKIN